MQIDFYKFYADWCVPCKEYDKVITQLKGIYPNINYHSLDVDYDNEAIDFIDKYSIKSIPFTIIRVDGEDRFIKSGSLSLSQLKEQIMKILL